MPRITLVEPRTWPDERPWVMYFGTKHLLAYGDSLDVVLDKCVDWLLDNAPGLLANKEATAYYYEVFNQGSTTEEARAAVDERYTYAGNYGDALEIGSFGLVAEAPSPREIAQMHRL